MEKTHLHHVAFVSFPSIDLLGMDSLLNSTKLDAFFRIRFQSQCYYLIIYTYIISVQWAQFWRRCWQRKGEAWWIWWTYIWGGTTSWDISKDEPLNCNSLVQCRTDFRRSWSRACSKPSSTCVWDKKYKNCRTGIGLSSCMHPIFPVQLLNYSIVHVVLASGIALCQNFGSAWIFFV